MLKLSPRLSPERQQEVHTLFMREAQLIANLRHPAILQVVEFSHEPFPWMALERLDGESLDAMLAGRVHEGGDAPTPMAPDEALVLLRPALEAIAFAHAHGVAHRDIKPGNFMVIRDHRGRPTLKVLDFGIARIMEPDEVAGSGQTLTAATLKTYSPAYAAPEQVTHARTGPWTDVHALALVLTEVLTGHAPYGDGDVIAMGAAAMSPARPTPAMWRVHVGPWEDVLARAPTSASPTPGRSSTRSNAPSPRRRARFTHPRARPPRRTRRPRGLFTRRSLAPRTRSSRAPSSVASRSPWAALSFGAC